MTKHYFTMEEIAASGAANPTPAPKPAPAKADPVPPIKSLDFAGNGATLQANDRHFRVGLPSGAWFALGTEPEQPAALNPVRNGLEAALKLEKKIADIKKDPRLTDLARGEKVQPLREAAAKEIATYAEQVAAYDAGVAAREVAMFAVPPIERTDAVTYLEDQDIRRHLLGLQGDERTTALESIQQGKNPRALLALMRSPVPLPEPFTEVSSRAWTRGIRNAKRREITTLASDREAVSWAQSGIGQLQALVRKK